MINHHNIMYVLQCYRYIAFVIMPYFVSMIWLAMSALGCWPNASGWSTLGSILMYSWKKKSLQLLERLFMSKLSNFVMHSLVLHTQITDHDVFFCSKTRASCWNQSQQTCCAFNQSEATLQCARFPALGVNCMFSRAWKRGSKGYCFSSCSFVMRIRFHSWEVGSTFEPCRNKICWW